MKCEPRRRNRNGEIGIGRRAGVEALERRLLLSGGYTLQTLGSFTSGAPNAFAPGGQLVLDSSGNIFGIATAGGANGTGAVFEVPAGSGAPVTVASFPASGSPLNPSGLVMDSGGNLFGFTQTGGDASGDGTLFEVPKGGSAIQIVAQFNGSGTGSHPAGNLVIDSHDNVFGIASTGGSTGGGSVWVLPAGAHAITPLAYMPTVTIGGVAQQAGVGGLAIDNSGNLFGTTTGNAAHGVFGTLWGLAVGTNGIQTLATFPGGGPGGTPVGPIAVKKSGFIDGVTKDGGNGGVGTIWQYEPGVGIIPLATLGGNAGGPPVGGVVLDGNGNLFGTTSAGGGNAGTGQGGVWELHANSTNLSVIQTFSGTDGSTPVGNLIADRFGDVYGTTSTGGANGGGTVFVMNLGGASTSAAALATEVTKSSLPANVVAGKASHGSATVKISNPSKTAVRGIFTVNIYASSSGAVDENAVKIGTKTLSFNLPGGKSKTLSVPVTFNPAAEGGYTILAQAADATGTTGAATGGPIVTATAPFISLSEVFSKVKLLPQLVAGQPTQGSATVKITNHGNVTSKGPTTVALLASPDGALDDATQIATLTRNLSIPVNGSASVTVQFTSIPAGLAGSKILIAQVTDPNGGISSANYATPINVTPA
jgi:uncharacterized repeat protein (TIGR03803 family)